MRLGQRLHEIFEERARAHPGRVAVTAPDGSLSYGELDAHAGALATRLRRIGVARERLVGLFAGRGLDLVVGLLGILKAGGAYVPVDPAWPEARVGLLLRDSAVGVIVSTSELAARLGGLDATVVEVDRQPAGEPASAARTPASAAPTPAGAAPTDRDLAYAIYTSGSTGTPKGVLVEHRNVVRLLTAGRRWFDFGEDDVWTLFHSVSFDFSVWELWGALLHGGRLVVVPAEATRSPALFHELLRRERVTVLNQTPSAFRQLMAADLARPEPADWDLRQVVFGGERLDVGMLRPWVERYGDERPALVNMYGITETTVHVTYRRLRRADLDRAGASPIGAPLPDLTVHLLDDRGRPVPDGTPGELYVQGPGVARGYLGRPELTAQRFVDVDGRRCYRSGDRALRQGGELWYLGRSDDQLQVRGYRIEPGEVEAVLSSHAAADTAVVVGHDYGDGDVRLVAFVTPPPGTEPTPALADTLRAALAERAAAELPPHMRPSAYEIVAELPVTPQGKVDRAALHTLVGAQVEEASGPAGDGELSDVERLVVEISEEVLRRRVPLHADLFDLGTTSLAFIRIVVEVNQRLGLALTGAELGDTATLARLAKYAESALQQGSGDG